MIGFDMEGNVIGGPGHFSDTPDTPTSAAMLAALRGLPAPGGRSYVDMLAEARRGMQHTDADPGIPSWLTAAAARERAAPPAPSPQAAMAAALAPPPPAASGFGPDDAPDGSYSGSFGAAPTGGDSPLGRMGSPALETEGNISDVTAGQIGDTPPTGGDSPGTSRAPAIAAKAMANALAGSTYAQGLRDSRADRAGGHTIDITGGAPPVATGRPALETEGNISRATAGQVGDVAQRVGDDLFGIGRTGNPALETEGNISDVTAGQIGDSPSADPASNAVGRRQDLAIILSLLGKFMGVPGLGLLSRAFESGEWGPPITGTDGDHPDADDPINTGYGDRSGEMMTATGETATERAATGETSAGTVAGPGVGAPAPAAGGAVPFYLQDWQTPLYLRGMATGPSEMTPTREVPVPFSPEARKRIAKAPFGGMSRPSARPDNPAALERPNLKELKDRIRWGVLRGEI